MKKEILKRFGAAALAAALLFLGACSKNNGTGPDPDPGVVSKETQARNQAALNLMGNIYLWNEHAISMMNTLKLNVKKEEDPVKLFGKMVHPDDQWSFMTDDMETLIGQVNNESKSYGYYLAIYRFGNTSSLYAVVWYVYPGTPAAKAGLTRGDIIMKINGGDITENNYMDLVSSSSVKIELGTVSGNNIAPSGITKEMVSNTDYKDPVVFHDTIESGEKTIGYLMYTDFVIASHEKLLDVFQEFKENEADEIILDLRYNGGGTTLTAELICNILAPESVVKGSKNIMTINQYNTEIGSSITYFGTQYKVGDKDVTIPVNMNLDRIFILASENTASSSELVIAGLKPYIDVILIGEKTLGKCYGGPLVTQEYYEYLFDTRAPELKNWGAYMMMFRSTNKNNDNYANGFSPLSENEVEDLYLVAPYGSTDDPLIARALEIITGTRSTRSIGKFHAIEEQLTPLPSPLPRTTGFNGMIDVNALETLREMR